MLDEGKHFRSQNGYGYLAFAHCAQTEHHPATLLPAAVSRDPTTKLLLWVALPVEGSCHYELSVCETVWRHR